MNKNEKKEKELSKETVEKVKKVKKVKEGFTYRSDSNGNFLTIAEIKKLIKKLNIWLFINKWILG